MKQHLLFLLIGLQFTHLPFSSACIGFNRTPNVGYPFPSDEVALIIWDEKKGIEHFIRQAKFSGKSKDFAFIVPVPATPEIEEAPKELLGWVYNYVHQPSKMMAQDRVFGGASSGRASKGVEVVKEQEVAGMNAVVIRSTDELALQKWLEENGFFIPDGARSWIQHYVKQKWEFVAFKLKSTKEESSNTNDSLASPVVRISFKTPRIVYPYRESALRKPIPNREFSLFVIAPTKVVGSYESIKPWSTYFKFSKPYLGSWVIKKQSPKKQKPHPRNQIVNSDNQSPQDQLEEYMIRLLKRKPTDPQLVITHFRNNEEMRPYDEDLYFDPVLKSE